MAETVPAPRYQTQRGPTRVSSGSVSHPVDVARKAKYRAQQPPTRLVKLKPTARNPASLG